MTIIITAAGLAIAIVVIVATIVEITRDGYRRVDTRRVGTRRVDTRQG